MFSEIDKEEKFQKEIVQYPINLGKFEIICFQNKYGKLRQTFLGKLKILESQIKKMKPKLVSQSVQSMKILKSVKILTNSKENQNLTNFFLKKLK